MKLLALDAATEACSAALYHDGALTERFRVAPREHASLLLPMAHELLDEAGWHLPDLDALAFGCGPGAFTGLRIVAATVQGLALGADLPVAPVSNLAVLAADAAAAGAGSRVLAVSDARMSEVYWCAFEDSDGAHGPRPCGPERVSAPHTLAAESFDRHWHPAGNGWAAYPDALAALLARLGTNEVAPVHPRAAAIARLGAGALARGESVVAQLALPTYVRNDVARKPSQA